MAGPQSFVQGAVDSVGKKVATETRDANDGQGDRHAQIVKTVDDVDERVISLLEQILTESRKTTALLSMLLNDEVQFDDQGNPL